MFILVRTDDHFSAKYTLKNRVVQIIGRGVLPDCDSSRISRDHASVKIDGDTLVLRALHFNPCFYRRSTSRKTVLSQGEVVELFHGDHFGLLPEAHWYRLIYTEDESGNQVIEKNVVDQGTQTKRPSSEDIAFGPKKMKTDPDSPAPSTSTASVGTDTDNIDANAPKVMEIDNENPVQNGDAVNPEEPLEKESDNDITNAESVDLNATENASEKSNTEDKEDPPAAINAQENDADATKDTTSESFNLNYPPDSDTDAPNSDNDVAKDQESLDETRTSSNTDNEGTVDPPIPNKANASTSNENDPKIQPDIDDTSDNGVVVKQEKLTPDKKHASTATSGRNEPDNKVASDGVSADEAGSSGNEKEVKKEPESPEKAPDAQPGCSRDNDGNEGPSKDDEAANQVAIPNAVAVPRERCLYGAHCYRKNSQHKQQYSHPGDGDYGPAEREACAYGARCRRADLRHWGAYVHPPGTVPPLQRHRQGVRMIQRRGQIFYINANAVHFHDDHIAAEDDDGAIDPDYEF